MLCFGGIKAIFDVTNITFFQVTFLVSYQIRVRLEAVENEIEYIPIMVNI